ncbi:MULTISPECIES: hypothetical protein [Bacillus]|uniref:hypothetical protein n=1 Tax=Bacillus TaxID=1386 RepID=UPI0015869CE8|nr:MULTISPECIES: hypothetical protein [Bacillus]
MVHGQHIKGEESDFIEISKKSDDILRQLLVAKHEIFSKKDLEIETFFTDLLFKTK